MKMVRVMKKILDNNLFLFFIIFIFGSLITLPALIPSFNCDGYCFLNEGYGYYHYFLESGRFLTALFYMFFRLIHLPINVLSILSVILSNIFLSLAVSTIFNFIKKTFKFDFIKNGILLLSSFLIIYNPFVQEFFLYEESFAMCLSLYFTVLAAYLICVKSSKLKYLISLILLVLASFLYQSNLCMYIPLIIVFSLFSKVENNICLFLKKKFSFIIYSCLIYVLSLIISFTFMKLYIKFFHVSSLKVGEVNILKNIKFIINSSFSTIRYWLGYVNHNIALLFWLVIFIMNIILLLYNFKKNYFKIICSIILIFLSVLIAYVPNLVMISSSNYVAPRMLCSIGAIFGFMFLLSLLYEIENNGFKRIYLISNFMVLILFVFYISTNYFLNQYYNLKRYNEDRTYINEISQEIKKYDNKKLKEVYYIVDVNNIYYDYRIKNIFSVKISAIDWGLICGLNYEGSHYNYVLMSSNDYNELKEKYKVNNNNYQLIYDNDKLYLILR